MSEGSKMGLFGSKDKTKDLKKENASKEESPERYAPYCIDSDSETYDTEALSIMDINDIIGIQSEPVGESTLESEIAALSQMITESKGDSVRKEDKKDPGIKPAHRNNSMITPEKVLIPEGSICDKDTLASDVNISDTSQSEAMSKSDGVSNSLQVTNDTDKSVESSVKEDSSTNNSKKHSDDSNLNHTVENDTSSCFRIDDNLTDPVNGPCNKEDSVSTEKTESLNEKQLSIDQSSNILSTESIQNVNTKEHSRETNNDNGSLPDDSISNTLNKEDTVPSIENISKSLQLIGEAYTSEDSQETNTNDNEAEKIKSALSPKETTAKDDSDPSFVVNEKDSNTIEEEESLKTEEITTPQDDISDTNLSQKSVNVVEESSDTQECLESTEPSKNEQEKNTPIPQDESQSECSKIVPSIDTEEMTNADESTESSSNTEQIQSSAAEVDQDANDIKHDEPTICEEASVDEQECPEESVNFTVKDLEGEPEENSGTTKAPNNVHENVEEKGTEEEVRVYSVTVSETVGEHLSSENMVVDMHADVEMDVDDADVEKCTVQIEYDPSESKEEEGYVENSSTKEPSTNTIEEMETDTANMSENADNSTENTTKEFDESKAAEVSKEIESSDTDNNILPNSLVETSTTEKVADAVLNKEKSPEPLHVTENVNVSTNDDEMESENTDSKQNVEDLEEEKTVGDAEKDVSDIVPDTTTAEDDCDTVNSPTEKLIAVETVETKEETEIKSDDVPSTEKEADASVKEDIISKEDSATLENTEDSVDVVKELDNAPEPSTPSMEEVEVPSETKKGEEEKVVETDERIEENTTVLDDIPKTSDEEHMFEEKQNTIPEDTSADSTQVTIELHSEQPEAVEIDAKDSQPGTPEESSQATEAESNELDAGCSDNQTQEKEDLPCVKSTDDSEQLKDSDSTEVSESEAADVDVAKNDEILSEEVSKLEEDDNGILVATEENKVEEADTELSKIDQEESLMEVEEEEAMDEEMNLTLDLEPDSERAVDETSRASEKSDLPESTEMSEERVEDSKEGLVLPESEENNEDPLSNPDEGTKDIQFSQEPPSDNTEIPAIDTNTESSTDQQLQDDSKIEESAENLKSILGNAEDVVQMLSEEQSQHSQDIMTRILDNVNNGTEMKNILETEEESVENVIDDDLQKSPEMTEDEELSEKIPEEPEELLNSQLEDPITAQNMDTLEEMLSLELMDNVASKEEKPEEESSKKEDSKDNDVNVELLLEDTTQESNVPQDYVDEMISDCLTDTAVDPLQDTMDDDIAEDDEQGEDPLKVKESMISDAASKDSDDVIVPKELEDESSLRENELDIDFVENPLESVGDLEDTEVKLDLEEELLLDNADQSEVLNDVPTESSQPNSEISELESAVKFLQESEEQTMDSPLVLSPKLVESVVEDISKQADVGLFEADEDICPDASDLVDNLGDIAADSISISEAEIISEAAKLESERKMAEQNKLDAALSGLKKDDLQMVDGQNEARTLDEADVGMIVDKVFEESARHLEGSSVAKKAESPVIAEDLENREEAVKSGQDVKELEKIDKVMNVEKIDSSGTSLVQHPQALQSEPIPFPRVTERVQKIPESKVSILEERLKEPPQIEIPVTEITRISDAPITPKNNLLIPKDAKINAYQRMLDSPKASEKIESKYVETPRKDSEKHDFENVGSPRIILKIAKSAIADCGEPRSPKSPKIRSATNSPNPEDSPGQKLGKIKLKLSRGGHPSIISNENIEETGQWHTEGSALSPIGMKIKLTKSGDASIISSEKHEVSDDLKDGMKRTESPIGMKIKLSKSGDASIVQQDTKDCVAKHKDVCQDSPKRIDSPIGMKIKLLKTGDASIIQPDKLDMSEDLKESGSKSKDRLDISQKLPKRTDSPLGVKIKLSKTGDASIVSSDLIDDSKETGKSKEKHESSSEIPKRTDSPIGMKIKLSKTKAGTSIVPIENEDSRDKLEIPEIPKRTESPLGMKIKLSKTGDASIIHSEPPDESRDARNKDIAQESAKQLDSPSGTKSKFLHEGEGGHESLKEKGESVIGMKIKLSKSGDASIIPSDKEIEEQRLKELQQDVPKRTESPLGMKIKLSKSGDASIVQSEDERTRKMENEQQRAPESSLGMKIKLSKSGDASIMEAEKRDKQQKRRENDPSLEMKIKLSKTGHPTIIPPEAHGEFVHKMKESPTDPQYKDFKESLLHKESTLKILKGNHPTIVSNRGELTIEPVQLQGKILENALEMPSKRKDVMISPIEMKKSKLEAHLSHILPEVTIQPVMSRDQKQLVFDPKTSLISRQQMNVISQEISITQVRPQKPTDMSISDKLKTILSKNSSGTPMNADCEIIEHRPELIIVNENSNSSQDVMIIDEVPAMRMPDSAKTPKKRGRPRRNPVPPRLMHHPAQMMMPRDPLALDEVPQAVPFEQRENERPKRTCRNQKSYAPPKRGRGRGRGKRKLEAVDFPGGKKAKLEQDLTAIEKSTMSVITLESSHLPTDLPQNSSELYKALKQPPMDRKAINTLRPFEDPSMLAARNETGQQTEHLKMPGMAIPIQLHPGAMVNVQEGMCKAMPKLVITPNLLESKGIEKNSMAEIILGKERKVEEKSATNSNEKSPESVKGVGHDAKGMLVPPGHPNWLTPTSKKQVETATRNETVSTVQVIDEDTRMSAESGSRSQTPARNIPVPASETIINEESQGSVLSTATTESEKVKVKNRRMEINFDPDEGPFTVDKIAEYEWPLDRKGETFMIQEQISQYLGVKSFKRKYPDLKRRMVDMEERNYLRENGLVSEAMCDMGLTAVCSSEVLDVMCSDFPDQYEEYRKHMREKQVKEHSKKQKELTAAANAEKNRIDLAEMAVQSAVSWNISLNKARRETRKCSLDLQTFTIHVPKKEQKVEERRASHYPVALIPGQYTDYYREYTPAELRYYPLNTVLYGPMRPNMRKFDSQSEGSQSDSDSDSSSDDSSSSSSEETQDTEESQSTMDDVDMELNNQKEEVKIKCKMCFKPTNKHGKPEILIQCGTCNGNVHPSCIDLTLDTVPHIQSYAWQCTDCKTCSQCHDPANEDKMLFCDMCDRGYHIYCVGLRRVPQGRWHCQECAVCANCSSREPGGANSDRNSVAQWQHEYKKGDKNTRVYVSTLCVPCSKLWRKGRYCPHCSRCHTATRLDLEPNLVHCSACDKYLHLGCVETKGIPFDKKNYLCDFCSPSRQQMLKPLASKIFKT